MAGRNHKPYPIVIRELEVTEAYDVTPRMRRIVLTGDQLGAFRNNGYDIAPFLTENADDHVKLVLLDPDDPSVEPPVQDDGHLDWTRAALARSRDYTPRRYDAEARRLELDFVRHPGGIASEWADRARPGDTIHVAGPRGTTVLPAEIDAYFLAGDETALPAIARRIEELPPGTPVTAVVSIPDPAEEQTFEHAADLHVTWVHRDRTGPEAFLAAIEAAPWPDGRVYAWAAGEAGVLRPLRRYLRDVLRLDPAYTDIAGYWRAGQAQQEMGDNVRTLRRAASLAVPYAIRTAISLDLAELVTEGHTSVAALADAAGADPRGLDKVLRLLADAGWFTLDGDAVGLTPTGTILLEDVAHERLDHRNGYGRLDEAWPGLLHAVTTGRSGFVHARGHDFWAELATADRLGTTFDGSLEHWSRHWAPAAVSALALTGGEHVVDVGGGTGTLLARVLTEHPGARGTLVELPTTADRAGAVFAEAGVQDRVTIAARSFFEPLPGDGDVYAVAQVLHDWPDAEAVAILRRVAEAARGARVVLVERLADDHAHPDLAFDLMMYAVFGSGERDLPAYTALAAQAGLEVTGATPLGEGLHLLDLRTAP
ncbi:siderophore-interacting protein [Actinomadura flavalba]|uniref:siderophore-interacting protein n=1 Tax=Actinomadura flavalba TaxID=1120938 RepID=UPI000381B5BE|nr:siderophore-interacting protein [Actinomadura flavalba]